MFLCYNMSLIKEGINMFAQFLMKDEFYKKYIQLYSMRQAIANLQMEDSKTEMLNPERTQEMYNNIAAFEYILKLNPDRITPYDLIDIADLVNKDIGYYAKGFRRTQVDVKKAKNFFPPSGRDVAPAVYSAFNAYHNIWFDLPVYEKEAKFHIELVRMQPFEDGNKRSVRILTNFNLLKQNKAPVVIPAKETDRYFGYIDDYNIDGLAKLLQEKSEEELEIMMDLYKSICGGTFESNPLMNISDEDKKTFIKAKRLIDDIGKKH